MQHCVSSGAKCDKGSVFTLRTPKRFVGADGNPSMIAYKAGRVTLRGCKHCGDSLVLDNVYIIDNLDEDLISGPCLAECGYTQIAAQEELWVYKTSAEKLVPVLGFELKNGRYLLKGDCKAGECKRDLQVCLGNCQETHMQRLLALKHTMTMKYGTALQDAYELMLLSENGFDTHKEYGINILTPTTKEQPYSALPHESLAALTQKVGGMNGKKMHNRFHLQSLDCKRYFGMVRGISKKDARTILQQQEAVAGHMCEFCLATKMSKERLKKKEGSRARTAGEVLNVDIKNFSAATRDGEHYYIIGVDEATSYHMVEMLKRKSDAKQGVHNLIKYVQNQRNRRVVKIRTDNAGELSGKEIRAWLKDKYGIYVVTSPPHCQRHNGIAEAGVKLSDTLALVYLRQAGMGSEFRGYATRYAVAMINLVPRTGGRVTRYQAFHKRGKPSIERTRAFGCLGMAMVHQKDKFSQKGVLAAYLGFGTEDHESFLVLMIHNNEVRMVPNFITDEKLFYRHWKHVQKHKKTASLTDIQDAVESSTTGMDLDDDDDFYALAGNMDVSDHELVDEVEASYPMPTPVDKADKFEVVSEEKYDIEEVLEEKPNSVGTDMVLVKWVGYDEPTWEPKETIDEAMTEISTTASEGGGTDALNLLTDISDKHLEGMEREGKLFLVKHLVNEKIPKDYNEIKSMPGERGKKWKEATWSEYHSQVDNEVFKFVPHCGGKKPIGAHPVMDVKVKELEDKTFVVDKFKVRLVGQGFTQIKHVDYDAQNYSPTMSDKSFKLIDAIAVRLGRMVSTFDFQTAYLQAKLTYDLYIKIPPGFLDYLFEDVPSDSARVKTLKRALRREHREAQRLSPDGIVYIKLNKALPGLIQSAKEWHGRLHTWLIRYGFKSIGPDRCVYGRVYDNGEKFQIVGIFVDDGKALGDDLEALQCQLEESFKLKWYPREEAMLGIHYKWNISADGQVHAVTLDQRAYIIKLSEVFADQLAKVRPYSTPMEPGQVLLEDGTGTDDAQLCEGEPYRQLTGSLLYLSRLTAPTLHFAVTQICRFGQTPRRSHWKAALRILRYAVDNKDLFTITYDRRVKHVGMYAFSDSEFATLDPITRKSFYGYAIFFCGGPIAWGSKQHKRATRSTTQAEYYALSICADEVMIMRQSIFALSQGKLLKGPTKIFCDNRAAIGNANGTMNPKASKHIELSYHLVRDYIENKDIQVQFIRTDAMVADILTKALVRVVYEQHSKVLHNRLQFDILMDMRSHDNDGLRCIDNKLYRLIIVNGVSTKKLANI